MLANGISLLAALGFCVLSLSLITVTGINNDSVSVALLAAAGLSAAIYRSLRDNRPAVGGLHITITQATDLKTGEPSFDVTLEVKSDFRLFGTISAADPVSAIEEAASRLRHRCIGSAPTKGEPAWLAGLRRDTLPPLGVDHDGRPTLITHANVEADLDEALADPERPKG